MTVMPRTTVSEVLESLEDEFADFAGAFARGEYLLWLGSGISRDVVPGVPVLLVRVLEFLRVNADEADPACRFRKALDEVLEVGGVPNVTRASLDFTSPVDTWPEGPAIVERLMDRYSDVLDVQVDGESEDFLVWTGLNVTTTYGAPGLEPDVEHLCVAILMLEGAVRSAPTTNWDGLVEAAMGRLVPDPDEFLRVIVLPGDFRNSDRQAELVKFHGCAVRAAASEAEYRGQLIARKSQISGWTADPSNQLMKNYLEHLFASRPALIVGLSAQDANIHSMLHAATRSLERVWPTSPPAVVFAERQLHHHHKHVLHVTYDGSYGRHRDAISEEALLGAFAKPALVGLVLYTLADKLCALVGRVVELSLPDAELGTLHEDIKVLRDLLAESAGAGNLAFVNAMVAGADFVLSAFRSGQAPDPLHVQYRPISVTPIDRACRNGDFPAASLGRLAIVIAALSRGLRERRWTLAPGTATQPTEGVIRLTSGHRTSRVFVVGSARATSQLELDALVDPDDEEVLVLETEAVHSPATRSPRSHYGRTGKAGARHVNVEDLCGSVTTADELFEAFRLEGAL